MNHTFGFERESATKNLTQKLSQKNVDSGKATYTNLNSEEVLQESC